MSFLHNEPDKKSVTTVTYCPEFSAMLWSWLSGSPASRWSPEAACGSRQGPGWPLGLLSLRWGLGGGGGGGRSGSESSLDITLCVLCYRGRDTNTQHMKKSKFSPNLGEKDKLWQAKEIFWTTQDRNYIIFQFQAFQFVQLSALCGPSQRQISVGKHIAITFKQQTCVITAYCDSARRNSKKGQRHCLF